MSDSGMLLSMPSLVAVAERSNSDNEKWGDSFIRIKIKLINIVHRLAYIKKKQYFCGRKNGGYTPNKRIWHLSGKHIRISSRGRGSIT